jgi:type IV pilus assembly protein PilC
MKIDLNKNIALFNHVSMREKVFMARQLATMLSAGLALDQSFKVLSSQNPNPYLIKVYTSIIADLDQGQSLSNAMSRFKNVFDSVFVSVVRSGESSGQLDKVLTQLADQMEMSQDFSSKVRSAMFYPAFIIFAMIGIIVIMMIFVIPQLKTVFTSAGAQLPWTTAAIVALSDFTVSYWWAELAFLIALALVFFFFFRSENGGSLWDRLKIKIPIMKELYTQIYMARFCRTMSMLTAAGLPIIETIAITSDVIQNRIFAKSLKNISAQVERGIPMSVPMQRDKNFPVLVSQMVMVGEQTGKMDSVLTKMADYYETETDNLIKGMAGLIEPVIIVVIGLGVGFLVYAIMVPIYSIAQTGF